ALVLLTASWASGQVSGRLPSSDFSSLQERLRAGDEVLVSTGAGPAIRGRMVEVSPVQITVMAGNVRHDIPSDQVTRVERRRNGLLLGALIGAGVGIPFGLALRSYAHNEGSNEAGALLFPVGIGLG